MQCWQIADYTVLKSNILAFRKVLRQQNRFSSRRERSTNMKFHGFVSKSTPGLQIRYISLTFSIWQRISRFCFVFLDCWSDFDAVRLFWKLRCCSWGLCRLEWSNTASVRLYGGQTCQHLSTLSPGRKCWQVLTNNRFRVFKNQNHKKSFCTFFIYIMIEAWFKFERNWSIKYFFLAAPGFLISIKIWEKVLTSVDTFGCRTTSPIQCSEIPVRTVLKSNISAFRKVLRHQNRFTSQRERSKNVEFHVFSSKSTPGLQISSNTTYFNDL